MLQQADVQRPGTFEIISPVSWFRGFDRFGQQQYGEG